jgi:hypothetical protein
MKTEYFVIAFLICAFAYLIYFVIDYEQVFEPDPQPNEIWGDNPFNVEYMVIVNVKDDVVLYQYRNWSSDNYTLDLSRFKRWYDKQEGK